MPRRAKSPAPSDQYGSRKKLEAAVAGGLAQGGALGPAPQQPAGVPVPRPAPKGQGFITPELLDAARRGPSPNRIPLSAPSQRPDEPVTAGVPIGPGPGPRRPPVQTTLSNNNTIAFLRRMADATGDPMYEHLYQKAVTGNSQ